MTKVVLKDCYIVINGTNFSDHSSSVAVTFKKADIDTTNFSGQGKEHAQGLRDDGLEITLQSDYAPASVDAVLYPLYDLGTEFTVEVRPTSAAVSTSNPKYTATCILLGYQPLEGKVGQLADTKIKFSTQRTGVTRATS